MMNIIIFAGGSGTRLWPASRLSKPKQLLKFIGNNTLIQNTYQRIRKGFKDKQIFIATTDYSSQIGRQLPKIPKTHYSVEPARKNRGPALGLALLIMRKHSPDQVFATAWADDHITDTKAYHEVLKTAAQYIKSHPNTIIAVGIKPTAAHTGFCYIQTGKATVGSKLISQVKKFTDKPTLAEAKKYASSNNYFWNTGYFVSRADHILKLYKKYHPKAHALLMKIQPHIGTRRQAAMIKKYYRQMPEFDFEDIFRAHPEQLLAAKANFDWVDVGRWSVVKDVQSRANQNLTKGLALSHETNGSLIYNYNDKQIVTTLHVKNLIVVVTPEAVLVTNKKNSEELKAIVEKLKASPKLKKFL
jgi:mannose-1-phosphate guanylyltransferase